MMFKKCSANLNAKFLHIIRSDSLTFWNFPSLWRLQPKTLHLWRFAGLCPLQPRSLKTSLLAPLREHTPLPFFSHPHHRICSPENCSAKPCLLVKKSVVNCRVMVLKVLCASWGSAEPLSSLRSTPPSLGPSHIRSTSWTSSVWKTRKCRLWREEKQNVTHMKG